MAEELTRLVEVVKALRNPETGCPWDSVQTNLSIRKYLVEEMGEYLDALEAGDYDGMKEELGDLLFQVVLNSQIAQDEGRFSIQDVAKYEADKMVRRHPHVFGDSQARTETELRAQWERIKQTEGSIAVRRNVLEGVPRSMPALARAHKLQAKAEKAGLAAPRTRNESIQALQRILLVLEQMPADASADNGPEEKALGEFLFEAVNLCRRYDRNSEELLQAENRNFIAAAEKE